MSVREIDTLRAILSTKIKTQVDALAADVQIVSGTERRRGTGWSSEAHHNVSRELSTLANFVNRAIAALRLPDTEVA